MNGNKVTLLSVGIGGYGEVLNVELLKDAHKYDIEMVGAVEPYPDSCSLADEFKKRGLPIFGSLEEFYNNGGKADLVLIVTPIKFHTQNIITALENGSNVICEKPLCGDERDIDKILEAREKSGKKIYIGYQWSFSAGIEELKKDILKGVFGKALSLKTLVLWPRNKAYFSRGTGWAGKIKDSDGVLIYDSIANNAAAHYLHNMFYLLGDSPDSAKAPVAFKSELYRANPIENFDTAIIECAFDGGATALFVASHSTDITVNPVFDYTFEKGRILFSQEDISQKIAHSDLYKAGTITAYMNDGTLKDYGNPFESSCRKIYLAADGIRGKGYNPCGVETAAVHTRFINSLQKNADITNFSADELEEKDGLIYVKGLAERLIEVYNKR